MLACGVAILVAHGAEGLLGLVPCEFCLLERRPYYLAAILAAASLLLPRVAGRLLLWAVAVTLLVGAALSFVHVGVEQHWWPDPLPECSAPDLSGMSMAQRLRAMPARPAKPCEDPDYLVPGVPVSMTQMGFVYALATGAILTMSLVRSGGRRP